VFLYFHSHTGSSNSQTTNNNPQPIQSSVVETPDWQTFSNIFPSSCNPGNCYSNYYSTSSNCTYDGSVLTCSYQGTAYYGFLYDCNLHPNGAIPQVNGESVPYLGCILGKAPINWTFSNIYTLSGQGQSYTVWAPLNSQGYIQQATMYPTSSFQTYSCSVNPNTITCSYLGASYSGTPAGDCNLGTPVQINGQPIPSGSCILQRQT
jgi:hypothetical protein